MQTLDRLVESALGLIAIFFVVSTLIEVFGRQALPGPALAFTEVRLLLVTWGAFLAGFLGIRRNSHIATRWLSNRLAGASARNLARTVKCLCGSYLVLLAVKGAEIIQSMSGIPFSTLPLDQMWLYLAVPVGSALMALALVATPSPAAPQS
jgi:C4-dicarboxylate transporter, DctQ subunit